MNPFPPDYDPSAGANGFTHSKTTAQNELKSELDAAMPLSPEAQKHLMETQSQLKRLYLMLLAFGLGLGVLMAIGLVVFLNHYGLIDRPDSSSEIQLLQRFAPSQPSQSPLEVN